MKNIIMRRPFMPFALAFGAGILISERFPWMGSISIFLFPVIPIFVIWTWIRKKYVWGTLAVVLIAFISGIIRYDSEQGEYKGVLSAKGGRGDKCIITGEIEECSRHIKPGCKLLLSSVTLKQGAEWSELPGKVKISIYNDLDIPFETGGKLTAEVRLHKPNSYKNKGSFDYERWCAAEDIFFLGSISKKTAVLNYRKNEHISVRSFFNDLREKIQKRIKGAGWEDSQGLLSALLLGDKTMMNFERKEAFRKSGMAHILAVSGLHMGIVALMINFILRKTGMSIRSSAALTITISGFFALLTGMQPPVFRAFIMAAFWFGGRLLFRKSDAFNSVCLAFLFLLLLEPDEIFLTGFQLTFIATVSILTLYQAVRTQIGFRYGRRIWDLFAVSISAQAGIIPLTAYNFHQIAIFGFIPYMIVLPLLTITLAAGLTAIALSSIPFWDASILFVPAHLTAELICRCASFFSRLNIITLECDSPNAFEIILFYIAVACLPGMRYRLLRKLTAACAIIMLSLSYSGLIQKIHSESIMSVTFLDVGNGDSSVIRYPDGSIMVIDGGGHYISDDHFIKEILIDYLKTVRIRHIDYLVLTHKHPDHIMGLFPLVMNRSVGLFMHNGFPDREPLRSLLKKLISKNIPVFNYQSEPAGKFKLSENDRSLILKIKYDNVEFLFTGDAERPLEKALMGFGEHLEADILKVAHHGSITSSTPEFLRQVSPKAAVISVGIRNNFGHPSPEVIKNLEDAPSRPHIFRTDQDGSVTVRTDGKNIWISTYNGRELELQEERSY